MSIEVTNQEFLQVLFGEEWTKVHVTSFTDDPSAIAVDRRGLCWAGGPASRLLRGMREGSNQYFCISLFTDGKRRRAEFDGCFVIVADDVSEKIPTENAERLPTPTYKLRTSEGSEQWGWVLDTVEEDRGRVDRLLDGLVTQGLVPNGKDPGMKGVTRYVRLPGGTNTKRSRSNFKCEMLEWSPNVMVRIESLASCFDIDLDADDTFRDVSSVCDVVGDYPDHPIWGEVKVTGYGADGWVRIDCPNAAEHSHGDPSGAAVRIMSDGSVQFCCHHGHCEDLTGPKIIKKMGGRLEGHVANFKARIIRQGMEVMEDKLGGMADMEDKVAADSSAPAPNSNANFGIGVGVEKVFDPRRYVYIAEKNQFWDFRTRQLITPAGLDNRYLSVMPKTRDCRGASDLLLRSMTLDDEADDFCWQPVGWDRAGRDNGGIIALDGKRSINTWQGLAVKPKDVGDQSEWACGLWLKHASYLIPDADERRVVLDYLACVVQRLNVKPAFWIIHRGGFGVGKDLFYRPLIEGLGDDIAKCRKIEDMVDGWGDYVKDTKFCIVEEVDNAQNRKISNAMKTLCAPRSSGYVTLNLKGGSIIKQRDCMAGVMMSNKRACLAIEPGERRYFVIDSYISPQDEGYYKKLVAWYENGGVQHVMDYLGHRDISSFNPHQLPWRTTGYEDLLAESKQDYEQVMEDAIDTDTGIFAKRFISVQALRNFAKGQKWGCGLTGLTEVMRNQGYVKVKPQRKIDGKKVTHGWYWIREADEKLKSVELYDLIADDLKNSDSVFPFQRV